jgi:hypothetical protein
MLFINSGPFIKWCHCLCYLIWQYFCLTILLGNSPQWSRASSFPRFLDHTQWCTTVGRTPLDKRSTVKWQVHSLFQSKFSNSMQSSASTFNLQHHLVSIAIYVVFLVFPSLQFYFPPVMWFRRQFLCNMSATKWDFLHFYSMYVIPLLLHSI